MLFRTTAATLLIALGAAGTASAQAPAKGTNPEFDRTFAEIILPVRQATLNGCLKHFPQSSQGIQAEWAKQMADPGLKALSQTPDFQKEVASYDTKIAQQMSTEGGRKEMENACRSGIDPAK